MKGDDESRTCERLCTNNPKFEDVSGFGASHRCFQVDFSCEKPVASAKTAHRTSCLGYRLLDYLCKAGRESFLRRWTGFLGAEVLTGAAKKDSRPLHASPASPSRWVAGSATALHMAACSAPCKSTQERSEKLSGSSRQPCQQAAKLFRFASRI